MANLLNKIRHDLNGLQPDDQPTLVQIGAALQQMVSELPAEATITNELLMSCLYGLQAIYQQTYTDFAHLKQAIETATIAAEQCLGSPDNPVCQMMAQQAQQVLSQAFSTASAESLNVNEEVSEDVNEAEAAPEPHETLPDIQTLDAAAAFFMQLQPQEPRALTHLRDALKALVTKGELSAEVKKLVLKAGKTTEQLLKGNMAEPLEAFASIGDMLGEAALANEFIGHEAATSAVSVTPVEPAPPAATAAVEKPSADHSPADSPGPSDAASFGLLPADADLVLMGNSWSKAANTWMAQRRPYWRWKMIPMIWSPSIQSFAHFTRSKARRRFWAWRNLPSWRIWRNPYSVVCATARFAARAGMRIWPCAPPLCSKNYWTLCSRFCRAVSPKNRRFMTN